MTLSFRLREPRKPERPFGVQVHQHATPVLGAWNESLVPAIWTNILDFTARVFVNSAARGQQRAVTLIGLGSARSSGGTTSSSTRSTGRPVARSRVTAIPDTEPF